MKIETADINTIKPYENNPRKLKDSAIEKVAMSLKEYGFRQPIVVDKDRIIVVGHTRYRASKKLGFKEVPITIADNLTPEQINAYRIADNRTAEESEWDSELLKMEIKDLEAKDFKLDLLGFNEDQLNDMLFEEKQGLTDEDEVPEAPEEPISKIGDIWKLGNHRVMCGDSTKEDDVKKLVDNNKIDLIYTDPPYGINEKGDRSNRGGLTEGNNLKDFKDDTIKYAVDSYVLCEDIIKAPRQVWWGGNYYCHYLPLSNNWFVWDKRVEEKQKDTQSDCELAWVKSKWSSVRIFRHLWKGMMKGSEHGQKRVHPTQKPVALAEWSFDYFREFDSVLDLFGGSGSTLIASEKKSKNCYMMEFEPHYVDVIIKRWENFTGLKAELENGQK
jgi:site-specific DNA-methyltransferase (adenine-specific)